MSQMKRGERIRELREIQNYTREAFAEKIDISPKFLYEIETGKKGFSADVLGRISKALSISCDYIMFGEDVKHYGNEKIRKKCTCFEWWFEDWKLFAKKST